MVYHALADIDHITIGTYENLRNFNNVRYLEKLRGGPSKGWYFSEKLLNFIKADYVELLHTKGCIDLIANENNMFSDVILKRHYAWNNHKPDVHKNYLLSISNIFRDLSDKKLDKRAEVLILKVEAARELYEKLWVDYRIKLLDESSDRHLGDWLTFLNANT